MGAIWTGEPPGSRGACTGGNLVDNWSMEMLIKISLPLAAVSEPYDRVLVRRGKLQPFPFRSIPGTTRQASRRRQTYSD